MSVKIGDDLEIRIGGYALTGITDKVVDITFGAVYAEVEDFETTNKITFALPLGFKDHD